MKIEELLNEDELRMLWVLLAETTRSNLNPILDRLKETVSVDHYCIFEQPRDVMDKESIEVRDINPLIIEKVYADDCDFGFETKNTKTAICSREKEILAAEILLLKQDETENTIVMWETKANERNWRNVTKLWSKLGDTEDIERREELSQNHCAGKKKCRKALKIRPRVFNTLVKCIVLYNSGTWGLSRSDHKKLAASRRNK